MLKKLGNERRGRNAAAAIDALRYPTDVEKSANESLIRCVIFEEMGVAEMRVK